MKKVITSFAWTLATGLAVAAPVALTTGNDYAPFVHSQLPGGGLATEVVRAAFEAQGAQVEVISTSWQRAMDQAKEGKAAGTFPWFSTKERLADFIQSEPIFEIKEHAFAKPDSKLDFAKPAQLAGSTMCLPTGWAAPPALADLVASGKVKRAEARDASFCLRMVQSGRADYFVTDAYQGRESMKSAGIADDALQMSSAVLASRALYLMVPRGQPGSNDLVESFNTGLRSIKKSGKYDQIVQRFIK